MPADGETLKEAVNNVLEQYMPEAKLLDLKETTSNGKTLCACRVLYHDTIINITIDPKTGKVQGNIKDEDGSPINTPDMAINQAMVRVSTKQVNNILSRSLPGASVSRTYYNKKDGTLEGYVTYQSIKYYFKINAKTGEIVTMQPAGG